MKLKMECNWCGTEIYKYPSKIKKHNFCSRKCLSEFSNKSINPTGYYELKDYTNMSANLSELNRKLNPTKMTKEMRAKMRKAKLGTGEGGDVLMMFKAYDYQKFCIDYIDKNEISALFLDMG